MDRKGQIFCGLKMIAACGSRNFFSGNFGLKSYGSSCVYWFFFSFVLF